jgi:hypothetical protein
MLNNPKKYTIREEISDPLHTMSPNLLCKLSWAPSAELFMRIYINYVCVNQQRRYSPIVRELCSRNVHKRTVTWVGSGAGGGAHSSCCPPPLPCCKCYCTSVQFTNFVRELLVNIGTGGETGFLVSFRTHKN